MGSEVVMVDDIPFTPENADLKPISLLGYGNLSLSLSLDLSLSLKIYVTYGFYPAHSQE